MKASLMVASGIIAMAIVALAVLGTVWGLGQTASADPDGSVTLVHLEPDGTDYVGNPYCPQTVWSPDAKPLTVDPRHDCNNIVSQKHVIRTDGFDEAKSTTFQFNKEGVGTIEGMTDAGVPCGELTLLTSRADWDDQCADATDDDADKYVNDGCDQMGATAETGAECGDGVTLDTTDDDGDTVVNDGCPAVGVSEDLGDQRCLVIHSSNPGETDITFTYNYYVDGESGTECANALDDDGDTLVNDGCPAVGDGAINDGCPKAATNDDADDDAVANDGCPTVGTYDDCDTNEDADCLSAGEPALCGNDTDDDGDTTVDDGCPQVGEGAEAGAECIDPESGADCDDAVDDDGDTLVNDGCAQVGATAEAGAQCANALDDDEATDPEEGDECANDTDDDSDGFVNDGCPVVLGPATETITTDAVIKEWDKIEDTVILKAADLESVTVPNRGSVKLPLDANDNGKRDADDAHMLDHNGETQDHALVFDEARKRLKSAAGPLQIVDVVHGYHADMPDHPTQGAVILAFLDSPAGCSYFTNPTAVRLWEGTDAGRVFQTGELNLGTAVVGRSDWRGFFIGPQIWPVGAQLSAEALAEADAHNLEPGFSSNSGVIPVNEFGLPVPGLDPVAALELPYLGVHVDTMCEEQATITFKVGYPDYVQSVPEIPDPEWVEINWVTIELAKQPQIRWAGEEIVLEKRWALPDDWYPEPTGGIDNDADTLVNEDPADDDGDTYVDEDPNDCLDAADDDGDTYVNDGCPAVNAAERVAECGNAIDDDLDGWVNDGCIEVGALGEDEYDSDLDGMEDGSGPMLPGLGDCRDGIDNDADTKVDVADSQCKAFIDEDTGGLEDDDDKDAEEGVGQGRGTCYDDINNDGDVDDDAAPLIDEDDTDCHNPANAFIDEDGPDICPLAGANVEYIKLDGPGGLTEGPISTWTTVDANCVSRAMYSSEEPGQVDVEAVLYDPTTPEEIDNKHAFLVWYLNIYQVKLTNVPGERADHNAGKFAVGEEADLYDPDVGDLEAETLNVSSDALVRVRVKGWFEAATPSGRGDVCIDMDGDGNGLEGDEATPPGEPYPAVPAVGCADPDDQLVLHGHWVLPDDLPVLAGPHPDRLPSWDVMSEPDVAASALIGPKSTLDSHDTTLREAVPCVQPKTVSGIVIPNWNCTRKTVDPDGYITEADALMPPLKILAALGADEAGFLKPAAKSADVGIDSAYQSVMIPANQEIPPIVNNGGYDWNSWGWSGVYQFDYPFFRELTKTTEPEQGLIRSLQFYTDNRGEGMFFVNGDYNLSFEECETDDVTGAPDCSSGDVVGTTEITVIGDYPYFRKHPAVESNPVEKTWTWGGDKRVTAERIDATHTAIIAHLKDRDGYCKYDVDYPDVTTSPSLNPVQLEEIEFILNTSVGSILNVSSNGAYNPAPPHDPLTDAVVTGAQDGFINAGRDYAVALAEDARVLTGLEDAGLVDMGARATIDEDECQAWVLIEHPLDQDPDVSVIFNDPEGRITRHWPPSEIIVSLVLGWNDSCYVGPEQPIEDAVADIIDDALAVLRLNNETHVWQRYFPDRPEISNMTTLNPYDQLFILMGDSATWTQEITPPPASVNLAQGWNSVCYAGASKPVEEATASIGDAFSILLTYGSDQFWRRYMPGRADLTNITTLNQFTSVVMLVTAPGGITWVSDTFAMSTQVGPAIPSTTGAAPADLTILTSLAQEDYCAPVVPGTYYGTVTIDGNPAADGITISAMIDGITWAGATTSGGRYVFEVPMTLPVMAPCFPGGTVTFTCDGATAAESANWTSGPQGLNLTCAGVTPQVTVRVDQGISIEALGVPQPGLGAFTIDATYNPSTLTPLECSIDPAFDEGVCNPDYGPNTVRAAGIEPQCGLTGDVPLATMPFEPADTVCPDDLLVSVETLADCDGGDILSAVDHKWWVGDVDRDFDKDAVDALFILQYVVGMRDGSDQCPPPPGAIHLPSADADCDGDVDAVDALFVLQHVVGLRPMLCPPGPLKVDTLFDYTGALAGLGPLSGTGPTWQPAT